MVRPTYHDPFPCGVGEYIGGTYPNHYNAYAVDFNRGSGTTDYGDWVQASADGTVVYREDAYGRIDIEHTGDGWGSTYAHLQCHAFGSPNDILVDVGDSVDAGQRIGRVGRTYPTARGVISPHLHYEQYFDPDGPARVKNSVQILLEGVPYSSSVPVYPSGARKYGPARTGWCAPSGVVMPEIVVTRTKNGPAPRTIDFDASQSAYANNVPANYLAYEWREDDENGALIASTATASKAYPVAGIYVVWLRVAFSIGNPDREAFRTMTIKILDVPADPTFDPEPPDPCSEDVVAALPSMGEA